MILILNNYFTGFFKQKTCYRITILVISIFLSVISGGCAIKNKRSESKDVPANSAEVSKAASGKIRIIEPEINQQFKRGEIIDIVVESLRHTPMIDSIIFYSGGSKIGVSYNEPFRSQWDSKGCRTGQNKARAVAYYSNQTTSSANVTFVILSGIEPEILSYEITNQYPHDIKAYTQGLVFEDGYLYEGTGQYHESSLRKVDIKTGEPVRILNLPGDIFGEGITIYNDKLFQLTYKSQVGFVYDKESFTRLQKVYYQNKEGWGLTTDGSDLIMSDGSHMIYFMDPEYFTEVDRIEVYDNKGPVSRLNELEYISGKIFANVYGTREIVVIEPETGIVLGRMNFMGILSEKDQHNRIDVFNGIAYNPVSQTIYVTGKYWPKLFEIKLLSEL
jgi:glutamine cyclotransferase